MTSRYLPVPDALEGERIDLALTRMLGLSRTAAATLIGEGHVRINGIPCQKSDKLSLSDIIEVETPEIETAPAPIVGMDILYDDEDVVVVNKPVGVAAHTGPGWDGPTVLGSLEAGGYRISTSGPPERQGIVHRLDVGTSGAMAVAKSELAYTKLKYAFKHRQVGKTYHAVVSAHPDPARGTIDAPIGRHPSKEWRMSVLASGRRAITHYRTLELLPGAALVEVELETGRTHQIRVHFAHLAMPCVGDVFYGADSDQAQRLGLQRQWLHATELRFQHPRTGIPTTVKAPYSQDLETALEILRECR
ncbi:MAG: RluA family pseudouridine synthase [Actinomycetaceae bacterium]|nr:RluA family pseudouridine synthase [Actinomycetaceae bacterium]